MFAWLGDNIPISSPKGMTFNLIMQIFQEKTLILEKKNS